MQTSQATGKTMIHVDGLTKHYGSVAAVKGISFDVHVGEVLGFLGPNGAGKTTTMRILAGEGEPYAGTVTRTGDVGYLPQDPREGDLDVLARDRVLSARGLDTLLSDLEKQQTLMAEVAGIADELTQSTQTNESVQARLAESTGTAFIANDTRLSAKTRMAVITGPNMGGKSTYMRQVALLTLLAYAGSFVPAKRARFGPIETSYQESYQRAGTPHFSLS